MWEKTKSFLFLWGATLIGSVLINKIFEIGNLRMVFYVFTIFDLIIFFLYATDTSSSASLGKAWEKVRVTFFMVTAYLLVRLLFGCLLDLPLSATFKYFLSLEWLLSGKFVLTQATQAFLLDAGLLIVICGSFAKFPCDPKKLQQFAMHCGTTLAVVALIIAAIGKISPIALQKIIGWGPQLNALIGNPLPAKLSYWWILGIAVLATIAFSIAKSKKPGEEITGWIVLLIGVALIVFVVGAIAGIFSGDSTKKIRFIPETMTTTPEGLKQYSFELLPREEVNTYKYSKNGYLKVEVSGGSLIGAFGRNGAIWEVTSKNPFETHSAPIGAYVFLKNNSDKVARVSIK